MASWKNVTPLVLMHLNITNIVASPQTNNIQFTIVLHDVLDNWEMCERLNNGELMYKHIQQIINFTAFVLMIP